jgi:hypothetical protein
MKTTLWQFAALVTTLAFLAFGCHAQPPSERTGLRPYSEPPDKPAEPFLHALLARVTGEAPEVAPVGPTPRRLAPFQLHEGPSSTMR